MIAVQPLSAGRFELYPSCIYDYGILEDRLSSCHQNQLRKNLTAFLSCIFCFFWEFVPLSMAENDDVLTRFPVIWMSSPLCKSFREGETRNLIVGFSSWTGGDPSPIRVVLDLELAITSSSSGSTSEKSTGPKECDMAYYWQTTGCPTECLERLWTTETYSAPPLEQHGSTLLGLGPAITRLM